MKWIRPTVQQQMKKMSKYILKVVNVIAMIRKFSSNLIEMLWGKVSITTSVEILLQFPTTQCTAFGS